MNHNVDVYVKDKYLDVSNFHDDNVHDTYNVNDDCEFVWLTHLDVVNVVAEIVVAAAVVAVDVIELDVVVHVAADKVDRLVDLDRLGELAVGLQVPRFVS